MRDKGDAEMDWEQAGKHIHKMQSKYEKKGRGFLFYLVFAVGPLAKRYDDGERTEELYKDIWSIE